MARGDKPVAGLIDKGDAKALGDLVQAVVDQDRPRLVMQQAVTRYQNGTDLISMPAAVDKTASRVRTGIIRSQHDMAFGILDNPPKLRIGTGSERDDDQAAAQSTENAANALYPFLESKSGGPIWARSTMDVVMFGFGVDSQRGYPHRVSAKNGMPLRRSFGGANDDQASRNYDSARSRRMRVMALEEEWPIEWSWTPSQSFYWRDGQESPNGITLTVENKTRILKDILESPLYTGELSGLRDTFEQLKVKNHAAALMARVRFVIVEDRYWCTYLVMPESPEDPTSTNLQGIDPTVDQTQQPSSMTAATAAAQMAQTWLWDNYRTCEIAAQFPNPVGFPQYTVTRGMFSNVDAPMLQYRGFCYGMLDLASALHALLSWRLTRTKREAFPAWVATTALQIIDGKVYDPGSGGPGNETSEIKLFPGADMATRLRAGETIAPVLNTGGGPNEEWLYREFQRLLEMQGIPSSLLDARGVDSGYLFQSLANTVTSRAQPIIEGIRIATVQRWRLTKAIIRALKSYLDIPGAINRDRHATFLRLDPEKFDQLEVVEPIYGLKRKENTAQDIANANNAIAGRLLTMEQVRSEFLGEEDSDAIDKWWLIYDWKQSPEVKKWRTDKALEMAGISLDQTIADQAGRFSLARILNSSPELVKRMQALALPGSPAYSLLQRVPPNVGVGLPPGQQGDQTLGPGQPPPTNGVPSPLPSAASPNGGVPTAPGVGGRPAGAAGGIPGGPRLQAGFGG